MEKLKMWVDVFVKITTGVLIATAVFITIFWGMGEESSAWVLWEDLAVSFLCSLGIFMFPTESEKEPSKQGMVLRQILYFIYVDMIVLVFGSLFGWFSFSNWKMVALMELLIVLVYAAVYAISYLGDYVTARSMNRKLEEQGSGKGR